MDQAFIEAERDRTYNHIAPNIFYLLEHDEALFFKVLGRIERDSKVSGKLFYTVHKIAYDALKPYIEPGNAYDRAYAFLKQSLADMIFLARTRQPFPLSKALAILALIAPEIEIPYLMVMQRALPNLFKDGDAELKQYRETFGLFIDILRMKRKTPEIQQELEQIKLLSIHYLVQNAEAKLNIDQQLMEEVLACTLLSRLYNISYWYIYGKQ